MSRRQYHLEDVAPRVATHPKGGDIGLRAPDIMHLLLFDIDGTLLMPGNNGRRLMEETLGELCGQAICSDGVSFSGRTDPAILHDILLHNRIGAPEPLIPIALERYVQRARQETDPPEVTVLPGVHTLLRRLSAKPTVLLALLTGNHEVTAYLKLAAGGLSEYFAFGAFGSDHTDRTRLPAVAARRAQLKTGLTFEDRDIVVIGDSTLDISCAQSAGARSIAVCTGMTDRATLAQQRPDVLLDDLTDSDAFCRWVLGPL